MSKYCDICKQKVATQYDNDIMTDNECAGYCWMEVCNQHNLPDHILFFDLEEGKEVSRTENTCLHYHDEHFYYMNDIVEFNIYISLYDMHNIIVPFFRNPTTIDYCKIKNKNIEFVREKLMMGHFSYTIGSGDCKFTFLIKENQLSAFNHFIEKTLMWEDLRMH